MTRAIGGFLAVALLLAACGDDSAVPTTEAVTPSSTATSAPATTAGTTATTGIPTGVAPCALLTADEVAVATGYPVTGVRDDPPLNCIYDLDTGFNVFIFVGIEDGMGRFAGAANLYEEYTLLIGDDETEAYPDIGGGAVCCPFRTMAIDAGDGRFVAVGVAGTYDALAEPLGVLSTLAEAILARL